MLLNIFAITAQYHLYNAESTFTSMQAPLDLHGLLFTDSLDLQDFRLGLPRLQNCAQNGAKSRFFPVLLNWMVLSSESPDLVHFFHARRSDVGNRAKSLY